MNLGIAIKELRKRHGLSQADLAEKAGLTQATLSKIERGKRPSDDSLKNLSEALKVPQSLIFVMALEKDDVPAAKQELYDKLFPVIRTMVYQIAVE